MKEHKVQIIRKEKNRHLPPEVNQQSITRVSSVFKNRIPLRPELKDNLERKLVAQILGIKESDDRFEERFNNFWAEITIKVDSSGAILDITTDENGHPVNPEDYLKYEFAKVHKKVADSKEEMLGNHYKDFYIRDPEKEQARTNTTVKARKKAYTEFASIGDDEAKMNMVLRAMGILNPETMEAAAKENRLEELARTKPEEFYQAATDKNLKVRAEILLMIDKGVLSRTTSGIYFIDDLIGETMNETIKFFKSKQNSETLLVLRDKLKEAK